MGIMEPLTLMEKLGVNNIGAPAEAGDTIMSRLQWFNQQMELGSRASRGIRRLAGRRTAQQMPRQSGKRSKENYLCQLQKPIHPYMTTVAVGVAPALIWLHCGIGLQQHQQFYQSPLREPPDG